MRVIKLIAIAIVENVAEKRLRETRLMAAGRLDNCMRHEDYLGASVINDVVVSREKKIGEWKELWVERISKI